MLIIPSTEHWYGSESLHDSRYQKLGIRCLTFSPLSYFIELICHSNNKEKTTYTYISSNSSTQKLNETGGLRLSGLSKLCVETMPLEKNYTHVCFIYVLTYLIFICIGICMYVCMFCVYGYFAWKCLCTKCMLCHGQRRELYFLGLLLETVVSLHVEAGDWIRALWKSTECS